MEEFIGEIITALTVAAVGFGWRQIEAGRLKTLLRSVIVGVEKGTSALPKSDATAVKKQIQLAAEGTGAQARLHELVARVTKEKKA